MHRSAATAYSWRGYRAWREAQSASSSARSPSVIHAAQGGDAALRSSAGARKATGRRRSAEGVSPPVLWVCGSHAWVVA